MVVPVACAYYLRQRPSETLVSRAQYCVVLHEGHWKIFLAGKHYGPYASQAAAIRAAVTAAQDSGTKGVAAQVLVQGENNQFREEWTYGSDPYPPPG